MIIKKANIIAFGSINNKEIIFSEGFNLVYGENEAGKSTIQSFIKIWLYGFTAYRGKDYIQNERVRFKPLNGDIINGELYILFQNKEYIIRRTFGKSKKEDTSLIIDAITGKEVEYIPKEEPGRYFFNVNRSTFVNTLFIGQLAVGVKKGKEEEIIDKLSASIGSEEGEVSFDVAMAKLEKSKKGISNTRKSGTLDRLKERYSNLVNERYEGYKLAEHNLDNEEKLIDRNRDKQLLNKEINNLDIYKKYLKKVRLQKEYEDITEYFRKKEELESKEKSIKEVLTFNNEVITLRRVNEIREEYLAYLNMLDLSIEEKEEIEIKESKLKELKYPLREYKYIDDFPDDILNILERIKIRKEVVREKININNAIENEIEFFRLKEREAKKLIGEAYKIEEFRNELGDSLNKYDENLRQLKDLVDKENNKLNPVFLIAILIIMVISFILGVISINKTLSIISYLISIVSVFFVIYNIYENKTNGNKQKIIKRKKKIEEIEEELDEYCKQLKISDYKKLVNNVKLYDDYLKVKEKISEKISDKIEQRKILEIEKAIAENEELDFQIKSYLNRSRCDNLDMLINDVYKYKKESKAFIELEFQVENLKNVLNKTNDQLNKNEKNIRNKFSAIGFNNIEMKFVEDTINELEEKVRLREDVIKSLEYVENTYSVLTKGKDMNSIKEELKDVININFEYSYKNEDEIDSILKEKNMVLVEVEKEIKDIENEIKNRFNGKRRLPVIEEEIRETELNIKNLERQVMASEIAIKTLIDAYDEIRNDFGPVLNNNVVKSFKKITGEKYKEVLVSDDYGMKVIDSNNIMPADILSNGANDQLYLSLRLAFIEMIFSIKDVPIYLDDAFVQYDDMRLEKAIDYLLNKEFVQCIIFTCQKREEEILNSNNIKYNYIKLMR